MKFLALTLIFLGALKAEARGGCAEALTVAHPVIGESIYWMSDFEELFLQIINATQEIPSLSDEAQTDHIVKLLKLKAFFLNSVFEGRYLIHRDKTPVPQEYLYYIIQSLGAHPEIFGIGDESVLKKLQAAIQKKANSNRSVAQTEPKQRRTIGFLRNEVIGLDAVAAIGPIGFIPSADKGEPLPVNIKRSIGFGEMTLQVDEPPARKVGAFVIGFSKDGSVFYLKDQLDDKEYYIPQDLMKVNGVEDDSAIYILTFNPEIQEWVVAKENKKNPSGSIGFIK